MEKVKLGKTNLEVSRLGLGGLFVRSASAAPGEARQAVSRAVELGVNYIDTAPTYGDSEEVLGSILEDIDSPVILSTKLGGRPQPFDPQDKDALRQSFEQSLKSLRVDHIDILMIHEPDRPGQYNWWSDMSAVEGPVLELIDELKTAGKIRYSGIGGTTVYELAHLVRSGKFDVVLTAFNYSLLWREAEIDVMPVAGENGVGVVAGSPLQQGALSRRCEAVDDPGVYWLSKPRRRQFKELYRLCDDIDMSLPELALRFVISNPHVDSVLMGAKSVTEVEPNVASVGRGPLPEDVLKRLDDIAAIAPFRPCEEPLAIGWLLNNPYGYKGPGYLR